MKIALITIICSAIGLGLIYLPPWQQDSSILVYKGPSCDCCEVWMDYMRQNGFTVKTPDDPEDDGMAYRLKIPAALASCHTAVIGDYIVEGHVPVSDINRLLDEQPDIVGIAVPGMPMGSPGMEGPYIEAYETLTFDSKARITVYASHRP